jgi:carboxymethylenebutenolidase
VPTVGRTVDIPTPRGAIDAYAAHPDDGKPYPLVILFMDVWGLREELFAIARRVATEGYYCMAPNLFYREGKFRFEPRNAEGRMVSFNTLPEDIQVEMRARAERLDRQTLRADVASILDFCRGEPVLGSGAGSIGFCMGGREAFFAAQEFPERFRATASLHGSRLVPIRRTSSPTRCAAKSIAASRSSTAAPLRRSCNRSSDPCRESRG